MKIGVNISIDVTKLDKARFFAGMNGEKYADLVAFIDTDQLNKIGKHGSVTQNCSKEERDAKVQMPFIGSVKVFYKDEGQPKPRPKPAPVTSVQDYDDDFDSSTIPF